MITVFNIPHAVDSDVHLRTTYSFKHACCDPVRHRNAIDYFERPIPYKNLLVSSQIPEHGQPVQYISGLCEFCMITLEDLQGLLQCALVSLLCLLIS